MKRLIFGLLAITLMMLAACKGQKTATGQGPAIDSARICAVEFSGDSAFRFVQEQCAFGPRVPNSEAAARCADYIAGKFAGYGLSVTNQRTTITAWDGKALKCRNIIAAYKPAEAERIIVCAHYDSRPWADHDPDEAKRREPVPAANDGASGVAVMLELARHLETLKPRVGIDFICFDLEDYGAPDWAPAEAQADGNTWCLGSQYWSANPHAEGYTARYGILLDMVGGRGATFAHEGFSLKYAQGIVVRLWEAATLAGAAEYFPNSPGGYITDDHVPMNEVAMIPTIDVVPFCEGSESTFGPTWHTTHDTPENIDPAVLRAVGQTVMQMISEEE